ncbi:hypothetical protein EMIT0111MI5_150170 [Burkholderia sp. IT-111MI5]
MILCTPRRSRKGFDATFLQKPQFGRPAMPGHKTAYGAKNGLECEVLRPFLYTSLICASESPNASPPMPTNWSVCRLRSSPRAAASRIASGKRSSTRCSPR